MEEIDYSVLFRWFVGLGMDDGIWSPTTFSKNRDRLLHSDIASAFFDAVLAQARAAGLLSNEHFTVDGTLLEAWASLKSFRRKDEGPQTFLAFLIGPVLRRGLALSDLLGQLIHERTDVIHDALCLIRIVKGLHVSV
jgi:hypothetical protein